MNFVYNSYGEVARVVLPTGGAIEYDITGFGGPGTDGFMGNATDSAGVAIARILSARREYANGSSLSATTAYSYQYTSGQSVNAQTTTETVKDASNTVVSQTTHYFNGNPYDALTFVGIAYNDWSEGREQWTQFGAPALKTISYAWQQAAATPWCNVSAGGPFACTESNGTGMPEENPRQTTIQTTLNDTQQVSQVVSAYDQFNNVTDRKEYDYGSGAPGALLRDTLTYYVTDATHDDIPIRLLRLPSQVSVFDGSGNLASLVKYYYDQGTINDAPGIVGHDASAGTGDTLRGNLTTKSSWQNTANTYFNETYTYDIAGNIVADTDPLGHATGYSYADANNTYAHPTAVTNALGQSISNAYDYYSGKLVTATDLNGVNTVYSYSNDPLDRLKQIRRAAGGGAKLESQTNYSYPSPAAVITTQDQNATGDGLISGQTLYDGFGRPITVDQSETSGAFIETRTTYDALGRMAGTTNPSRPGDGLDFATTYTYDALNRPQIVQTADASQTATSYSGNTTTVADQTGRKRVYTYDAIGRLTSVVEDPTGANLLTSYGYDALGDLKSVSQSAQTRTFSYDSLQRLLSSTQPESGTINYQYDGAGNLVWRSDARGEETCYAYDATNRLRQKIYFSGSVAAAQTGNCAAIPASALLSTPAVTYAYDNNPAVPYSMGRLTQVSNGMATTNYLSYDPLGRVTGSQENIAGQSYYFVYNYDLTGALTSETYPSGRVVNDAYDNSGRVSQVSGGFSTQQTTYVSGFNYQPAGAPSWYLYGNGLCRSFSYNSRLQLSSSVDSAVDGSAPQGASCVNGADEYLGVNYNWTDPSTAHNNGNLWGLTSYHGGPGYPQFLIFADTFTYDVLNRVTGAYDQSADGGTTYWYRQFQYDNHGNLWTSGNGGMTVSGLMPQSNVYTAANQLSNATYDAAGNQVILGADTFAYDAENRLTQLTVAPAAGGGQVNYLYDGNGQRVQKTIVNGNIETYVHDIQGRLIAEYASIPPTAAPPCGTCYLSTDQLGSTRLVTGADAAIIARHDYVPFGEEVPGGQAGRLSEWDAADNVNQKFTAKERDQETGLDYFGARYYGSALGRWTSPDVVNVTDDRMEMPSNTLNKYIYGGNNPLKFVDPDGEDITVYYTNGGMAGHTMMMAYNQATGDSAVQSFGPVSHSAASEAEMGLGIGVPGTANYDFSNITSADQLRQEYASITIQTSPEETQKVIQYIRTHSDGDYKTYLNNCTTTCAKILRTLSLYKKNSITPKGFFTDLLQQYGASKTVPNNIQNGTDYGKPRSGYDAFSLLFLSIQNQESAAKKPKEVIKTKICYSGDDGKQHCDSGN